MSFGYLSFGPRFSRSGRHWACLGGCSSREASLKHRMDIMSVAIPLDVAAAEEHLMRFLSIEGVTGYEANIAAAVSDALKAVGVPSSAIRFDDANTRIPLPTETGNLIVDLPGTRKG